MLEFFFALEPWTVITMEYEVFRFIFMHQYVNTVREAKHRAEMTYARLMLQEITYLINSGWPREKCELPAMNNLAVRKAVIEQQLQAELNQLQQGLQQHLADYRKLFGKREPAG